MRDGELLALKSKFIVSSHRARGTVTSERPGRQASAVRPMMQGGRAEGGGRSIWGQGGLEQQGSARGSRPGRRRGGNKSHAAQPPVANPQWPVSMSLAGFHGDSSAQRNGPSPSEYYGSMAAGSIVGAASRCGRQVLPVPQRPVTEPQGRRAPEGRSQNGRRARPTTGEGKGPTSCRAQTIRRHEGWMHLRPAELQPSAVQEAGLEQRRCVLEVAALLVCAWHSSPY